MTLRHNLDAFRREARAIAAAIPEEWRDRAVRLGVHAYSELVKNTEDSGSVDTGAYRAEHVIEQGGGFLYENPDRPGPDAQFPSRKALGQGPIFSGADLGQVEQALEQGLRAGSFGFANRRFYAGQLEFGTASIEPRMIYARARESTAAFADALAREPATHPDLRRAA